MFSYEYAASVINYTLLIVLVTVLQLLIGQGDS
jgi:hypothetical protein